MATVQPLQVFFLSQLCVPSAVAELVEHGPLMWEIGGLIFVYMLFYVLATSKVILGLVLSCDSVHT